MWSLNDGTYTNFWHYPTKRLSWILADQTWQVTDDTGSLDFLTHTDDEDDDEEETGQMLEAFTEPRGTLNSLLT